MAQPPTSPTPTAGAVPPRPTLADVWAKLGRLLFHWSILERQLTEGIRLAQARLGSPTTGVAGTIADRIAEWYRLATMDPAYQAHPGMADSVRAQADALRKVRNDIIHGLVGAHATSQAGLPSITCAEGGYDKPTGRLTCYTVDELEHITQGIDACARSFILPWAFNYIIDPAALPRPHDPPRRRRPQRILPCATTE